MFIFHHTVIVDGHVSSSDVAFFSEHLEKYHSQHKMAESIVAKRPIGMLLVDALKMKNQLIPSPLRCLDVSHYTGPYVKIYCGVFDHVSSDWERQGPWDILHIRVKNGPLKMLKFTIMNID